MSSLKSFRMDEALGRKQIIGATKEIKALQHEINRLEGSHGVSAGRGRGSGISLRGVFGSLLPAVGLAAVTSFGAKSVHAAMDFQTSKTKYGVLTGSQETGDMLAGQLRQLKQDSILGTAVYPAAEKMLGFGVAASKIMPDLKMIGDISMGDAAKLQRITLAFSEVEAAGKLNGRRLLQFINAGFNPLLEISKNTGKSMEQLTEQMRKGGISSAMLEAAFKSATDEGGRFAHMIDKVAETPLGKLKKLEGQFNSLKIDIGEALMPLATLLMNTASFLIKHIELVKAAGAGWLAYAVISKASLVAEGIAATAALGPIGLIAAAVAAITFAWTSASKAQEDYNKVVTDNANKVYSQEREGIIADIRLLKQKNPKLTDAEATKRILESETGIIAQSKSGNAFELQKAYRNYQGLQDKSPHDARLMKMRDQLQQLQNVQNNFINQSQALDDLKKKGVTAADIHGTPASKADGGGKSDSVASSIAGGGPRVININGVKFTDKIELHGTMHDNMDGMERKLEEMFLRILNSGASVQGN